MKKCAITLRVVTRWVVPVVAFLDSKRKLINNLLAWEKVPALQWEWNLDIIECVVQERMMMDTFVLSLLTTTWEASEDRKKWLSQEQQWLVAFDLKVWMTSVLHWFLDVVVHSQGRRRLGWIKEKHMKKNLHTCMGCYYLRVLLGWDSIKDDKVMLVEGMVITDSELDHCSSSSLMKKD